MRIKFAHVCGGVDRLISPTSITPFSRGCGVSLGQPKRKWCDGWTFKHRSCSMEHPNLKADEYLEKINHAPYEIIFGLLLGMLCLFTLVILVGIL
jgi:hypothetical protein